MFSNITAEAYKAICIFLFALLVVAGFTTWYYSSKTDSLQSKLDRADGTKAEAVKQAKKDYNETVRVVTEYKTEYKTKTVFVETYIGDINATPCEQNGDFYHDTRHLH